MSKIIHRIKMMKLPRAHARGIFSSCFVRLGLARQVGSKIPPKQNMLRIHPRIHARGILRRRIKNKEYILLSLILLLGFVLRLYKINNPIADWHSFRQADTASVSRMYVSDGINLLIPRYHDVSTTQSGLSNLEGYRFVEFPVFNAIHTVFFNIFPSISLEIWGRLISIISATVSTYILFLLGRRFISIWGGVLAAFFYATLPFNVFFTRVILPEPMAVTFALASLWMFARFIESDKNKHLFTSAAFMSVSILIKPYLAFYGVPILYLLHKKCGYKKMLKGKKYYMALFVVIVPFFVWRMWMQQFPEGIPFWKWTFNGDDIRFRPSFWRWIFGERLAKLILGYWGLIPFAIGILREKKNKFITFCLLGMLLYVSIIATANVRHDYYQTIVVPTISLALAAGSVYLWKAKHFDKNLSRGILVSSIFIMMITSAYQVREYYKVNHPEIIEAGKIADKILPKDELIIAPYNGDTAFLYQTSRMGWPVVDRPIDELIELGASYFVSVDLGHYQTVEFGERFETIYKTDKFIILSLKEELQI